jgi:hypothetical protein
MADATKGQKIWNSFRGGRYTRANPAAVSDDHCLIANDMIFPGDAIAHKRPGYTLVKAVGYALNRIFGFQRQSDSTQLILMSGSGKLAFMKPDGSVFTSLSTSEDATAAFDFATNVFEAYGSNGKASYRFFDSAGTLTKRNWGMSAPAAAPSISVGGGSLNLTYGRQYAYSPVSKFTDSTGVTRVHVGPPSPLSAHTGPFNAGAVTVGSIPGAPADSQITHWWIWATNDTPFNTTSVLFFAAEITVGTTSWGDTLADTSLDTTREIPYDNQPAPFALKLLEFQQRIVALGIPGKPNLVQFSGLEETPLGIPQQSWPLKLFFNVPGKTKALTGGEVFNEALMLGTQDFWFRVDGLSSETFAEEDFIISPGPAGFRLTAVFGGWLLYLGVDKKLWAWNGAGEPMEVSWKIARRDGSGMLAMEDLSSSQLANCELRVYSFGRYSCVVLLGQTSANPGYLDWFSLWDVSALAGPAGPYGTMTEDGHLMTSAESDMFPSHHMATSAIVMVGLTPYLFLADINGNVYRWPDGFTDAGTNYGPQLGSEFSDLNAPEWNKRMRTLDLKTSRADAISAFSTQAAATEGINWAAVLLNIQQRANPTQPADTTVIRAQLEHARGASYGKLLRWLINFPKDANDCELYAVVANSTPVNQR